MQVNRPVAIHRIYFPARRRWRQRVIPTQPRDTRSLRTAFGLGPGEWIFLRFLFWRWALFSRSSRALGFGSRKRVALLQLRLTSPGRRARRFRARLLHQEGEAPRPSGLHLFLIERDHHMGFAADRGRPAQRNRARIGRIAFESETLFRHLYLVVVVNDKVIGSAIV